MLNIDTLVNDRVNIDNKWVIARPLKDSFILNRIKDAVLVLNGKADAVKFYKQ